MSDDDADDSFDISPEGVDIEMARSLEDDFLATSPALHDGSSRHGSVNAEMNPHLEGSSSGTSSMGGCSSADPDNYTMFDTHPGNEANAETSSGKGGLNKASSSHVGLSVISTDDDISLDDITADVYDGIKVDKIDSGMLLLLYIYHYDCYIIATIRGHPMETGHSYHSLRGLGCRFGIGKAKIICQKLGCRAYLRLITQSIYILLHYFVYPRGAL